MFDMIRADFRRARELGASEGPVGWHCWCFPLLNLGWYAVLIYRYGAWARKLRPALLRYIAQILYLPLCAAQHVICQTTISTEAQIGPGFMVCRRGRVYVGSVKAGRNLYVSSDVVIAYIVRSIGDNVFFSVGSKALGPAIIGSNVMVGANAVITSDVPDNSVVLAPHSRTVSRDVVEGKKTVSERQVRSA